MRSYQEIMAGARDEPPFSNGTECSGWQENWCYQCHNPVEVAWQKYSNGQRKTQLKGYEGGCPLIMAAYNGVTPTEWLEGTDDYRDRYHCIEFRGPDDGPYSQPRPKPEPPQMDGLFKRPERSVRMLKQPSETRELVPV